MTRPSKNLAKRSAPALAALLLCAALAACNRSPSETPLPRTADATPAAAAIPPAPGPADPSVPDAKAALANSGGNAGTATGGSAADSSLSPAQESTQMPLPGQVNDHSLPSTGKRADQGGAAASAALGASAP